MNLTKECMLGLVELANADDVLDIHGADAHAMMREEFQTRMKKWIRSKDEWQVLDNHRFCVVLRDVSSQGELELAAAKLARIFEEPQQHYGRPITMEVTAGFTRFDEQNKDKVIAIRQAGIALMQARVK